MRRSLPSCPGKGRPCRMARFTSRSMAVTAVIQYCEYGCVTFGIWCDCFCFCPKGLLKVAVGDTIIFTKPYSRCPMPGYSWQLGVGLVHRSLIRCEAQELGPGIGADGGLRNRRTEGPNVPLHTPQPQGQATRRLATAPGQATVVAWQASCSCVGWQIWKLFEAKPWFIGSSAVLSVCRSHPLAKCFGSTARAVLAGTLQNP